MPQKRDMTQRKAQQTRKKKLPMDRKAEGKRAYNKPNKQSHKRDQQDEDAANAHQQGKCFNSAEYHEDEGYDNKDEDDYYDEVVYGSSRICSCRLVQKEHLCCNSLDSDD